MKNGEQEFLLNTDLLTQFLAFFPTETLKTHLIFCWERIGKLLGVQFSRSVKKASISAVEMHERILFTNCTSESARQNKPFKADHGQTSNGLAVRPLIIFQLSQTHNARLSPPLFTRTQIQPEML